MIDWYEKGKASHAFTISMEEALATFNVGYNGHETFNNSLDAQHYAEFARGWVVANPLCKVRAVFHRAEVVARASRFDWQTCESHTSTIASKDVTIDGVKVDAELLVTFGLPEKIVPGERTPLTLYTADLYATITNYDPLICAVLRRPGYFLPLDSLEREHRLPPAPGTVDLIEIESKNNFRGYDAEGNPLPTRHWKIRPDTDYMRASPIIGQPTAIMVRLTANRGPFNQVQIEMIEEARVVSV